MSVEELDSLKQHIGQFISINAFFSTSIDPRIACAYAGDGTVPNNLKRILFEIDADPSAVTTKPFADISSYSHFFNESEVLFMVGSIFNVISITSNDNHVWTIQMRLCGDDENNLQPVLKYLRSQNGTGETNLQSFGNFLWKMGRFDLAEKY